MFIDVVSQIKIALPTGKRKKKQKQYYELNTLQCALNTKFDNNKNVGTHGGTSKRDSHLRLGIVLIHFGKQIQQSKRVGRRVTCLTNDTLTTNFYHNLRAKLEFTSVCSSVYFSNRGCKTMP